MRNRKVVWVSAAAATGLALTGGAVTAGLVWADPADGGGSAQGECEVSVLTEDVFSHANGVSPSGAYIAGATYTEENPESERAPVLWDNGEAVDISDAVKQAFPETNGATLEAINDEGVAVGNTAGDAADPFRYRDGEVAALQLPDAVDGARVQGIAADGTVLGLGKNAEGQDVAVTWEADSDEGAVVEAPEGVVATHIDDNGQLAGYSVNEDNTRQVWHTIEGEWIEPEGATFGEFDAMSFAGEFLLAGGDKVDLTTGEAAEHDVADPEAINANGTVYGVNEDARPVMDAGDGAVELPSPNGDDHPLEPMAANADGSVVVGEAATGNEEDSVTHGVVWNCQG